MSDWISLADKKPEHEQACWVKVGKKTIPVFYCALCDIFESPDIPKVKYKYYKASEWKPRDDNIEMD